MILWQPMKTMRVTLLAVLLTVVTVCELQQQNPVEKSAVSGVSVVKDGDSLTIGNIEIRLWGIDAVELYQICQRDGTPWNCGQAAKQALASKSDGQPLICYQKDIDRYGRTVAECFAGAINLNAWMVRYGWALAYQRYARQYMKDEKAAKAEQRGVWQSQFIAPWKWRQ